jgi:hypothetical protein
MQMPGLSSPDGRKLVRRGDDDWLLAKLRVGARYFQLADQVPEAGERPGLVTGDGALHNAATRAAVGG